ncbi:MAG: M28 family peptidase [Planctomycetota bacterium]|nr:MAG: M28 family peptidase [Planctomycetota bacterium]
MNVSSLLVLAVLVPALPRSSQDAPAARLAADVAWLADDAREGRRAGTPGESAAADWLAVRLRSLGLEPAGEGGFFQSFEVPLPARDAGGSWLEAAGVERCSGPSRVVPLTASERGAAEGRLLFRGYGIVNEERGWDDYGAGADIEGAVVLVVRGAPKRETPAPDSEAGEGDENPPEGGATVVPGDGWGASATLFHKIMTAKRLGARAVLVAQPPDAAATPGPLPGFGTGSELRGPIPALAISAAVAGLLVRDYADAATALARVDYTTTSGAGRRFGVVESVRIFADVEREHGEARNVLARLPGRGGPTIVVGAHFDHLGRGGTGSLARGADGEIHNGADDNASGTAVVLEVARRLAEGEAPQGDVLFALWSGEELGLLGSEHWVQQPTIPLADVAGNLNLDMVGRCGGGTLQVLGAGSSPAFAAWMEECGEHAGLELAVSLSGQGLGGSDHQTFLKREIPALHLFSGLHGDYHKPSDDAEKFEAAGAAHVVTLALDLIARMQSAGELEFLQSKMDASRPRGGRWSVWFGTIPEYGYDGTGLLLSGTSAGSPAEHAGLMQGDVLTKVGDVDITDIHAFVYALQIYKPGDVVLTRFLRDGEEQSVRVTLATRDGE